MSDPKGNPQRYQWPWFVLAAFLLAVALAIVWIASPSIGKKKNAT